MADKTPTPVVVTYPRKWESVTPYCERLKIPGGWIARTWNDRNVYSMCVVPDETYLWILEK